MSVLLLDNYDSFTYNLYHLLEQFDDQVDVIRNDEIDPNEVSAYDRIVLSPGPGLPQESGRMLELIDRYAERKPILGVCLGMQALAVHAGMLLRNLDEVKHGRSERIRFNASSPLFRGIDSPMEVGLYHSWVVDHENSLSDAYESIAMSEDGLLMAMQHRKYALTGIQFHPESVMTPDGVKLIGNWMEMTDQKRN